MSLYKSRFTELIKNSKFSELFNELGWDHAETKQLIAVDEEKFNLNAVAEKRGFVVFICSPDSEGKIPHYSVRKKIDAKITKLYFEHLIIYTNKDNSHQVWQLVIREPDKPIVVRETPYFQSQQPDLLFQRLRGIFISLDEEEKITLADVRSTVREQFNTNAEKVTKKFYDAFKDHHKAFLSFIKGIESLVDKEWYASLMLNRLMFIYFIQKKSFLDDNPNYLNDKLKETQKKKGKDKFYSSFYRDFLLILFHKGLGLPESERTKSIIQEIGKVPYLNGGLFDEHQIEKNYEIKIEDNAFEKIFKFFDEYNWHLDTKITATGRDINPDVIGYIFEKYINDRASMGAYYTKEDITEYIAKNTIIPFLFDEAKKGCKEAFEDDSSLWKMMRENPDRYIYDAVKHGIYQDFPPLSKGGNGEAEGDYVLNELPPEIQIGLDTTQPNLLARRKEWNKPAPPEFALPTEIWREVVERRNRYFDIKKKIESGEIKEINDFITYNLNIRQFAQDALYQYEGSDFINAFYTAIAGRKPSKELSNVKEKLGITILDPTCGSGAFLFAALNILESLYEECIRRMRRFVLEDDRIGGKKFPQFRKVLEDIEHHPNERYYIYKSIILNNLYGVDIMNEAVEIAKLRLFLKLVAEVEDFNHLEPLPDIDFNIRAGNTLVGFATKKELDKGLTRSLNLDADTKKVYDELDVVARAFKRYKEIQLEDETDHKEFKKAKDNLNSRLKNLNDTLNEYLGNDYGKTLKKKKEFEDWLNSYKPFHWFAEFYEILSNNFGFDIIIGNPPYIEYSTLSESYLIKNFNTIESGNSYAYIIEKSYRIIRHNGMLGMIVQLPIVCTDRMISLQKECNDNSSLLWFSNFDDRPGKLFDGLEHIRATILLSQKKSNGSLRRYTTKYNRWYSEMREYLFQLLEYRYNNIFSYNGAIPKLGNEYDAKIYSKIKKYPPFSNNFSNSKEYIFYYHNSPQYFIRAMKKAPFFWNERDGEKISTQVKSISVNKSQILDLSICIYNCSLFYWWFIVHSDCRHLNMREIASFTFPNEKISTIDFSKLRLFSERLIKDYEKNKNRKESYYKASGKVIYDEYFPKHSKVLIDEIEKVISNYYGLSDEELDFIINYDIKYRMGKELEEE